MKRVRYALCLMVGLTALSISSTAFASWSETFPADSLEGHVESKAKYIVVSVKDSEEEAEAAKALRQALRQGPVKMVMDDSALGDVSELSDEKIVEEAKKFNVDYVAVVRTYPGGDDSSPTAVVTTYRMSGQVEWTVSANKGTPISAANPDQTEGVSRKTGKAVAETTGQNVEASSEAKEKFAKEFIWFQRITGVTATGAVLGSNLYAKKGKFGARLSPDQFYREVGKPDLADEYSSRKTRAKVGGVLGWTGVLAAPIAASWWMTAALVNSGADKENQRSTTGPALATVSSLALAIAGFSMRPSNLHPIGQARMRELAEKHNKELAKELGLPSDYEADEAKNEKKGKQGLKFNFQVGATDNGGYGGFSIRF